jgi:hypothetical protein
VAGLERSLLSAGSAQGHGLTGLNADARLDIGLALAAMNGHAAMVLKLVSLGAAVNHRNKGTLSPVR